MSGQSDFTHGNNAHTTVITAEVIVEEERKVHTVTEQRQTSAAAADVPKAAVEAADVMIPLADLGSELQLSAVSVNRDDDLDTPYVSPIKNSTSLHSLYRLGGSCGSSHSCCSRSESRLDQLLNGGGLRLSGSSSSCEAEDAAALLVRRRMSGCSIDEDADRNVTELTFANSEIDASSPFKEALLVGPESPNGQVPDSGSDSGFSDPSPEATAREKTPTEEEEHTR